MAEKKTVEKIVWLIVGAFVFLVVVCYGFSEQEKADKARAEEVVRATEAAKRQAEATKRANKASNELMMRGMPAPMKVISSERKNLDDDVEDNSGE